MDRFWTSGLGSGYLPGPRGTWGSAVVAGGWMLLVMRGASPTMLVGVLVAVALISAVLTVTCGPRVIARCGPDPGIIVSDEQCGQALTYLGPWCWLGTSRALLAVGVAGFLLFRVFDIIKPPPVRQLERVPGAWGVLLDDVMAGVYAHLVLQAAWWAGVFQATNGAAA